MTVSPAQLLSFVVEYYDDHEQPVTVRVATQRFDTTAAAVSAKFERLVECELLVCVDGDTATGASGTSSDRRSGGYRPTITGRELLERDLDDGSVIVDPDCEG